MKTLGLILLLTISGLADQFSDYWYAGKAEIAVYGLEQWGYSETRKGTATLIFVTEPFSKSEHVKLDSSEKHKDDSVSVLKMNRVKKYTTGLYPYSIMSSAFSTVKDGRLLKVNTSLQEWCGHTFLQANLKEKGSYLYEQYSYFQKQSDKSAVVSASFLEEELFLRIRLGLPIVSQKGLMAIPAQEYTRLLLLPYESAKCSITVDSDPENRHITISYDHPLKMKTEITASKTFPYVIQEWKESYFRGGQEFTNKAVLKTVQLLPYWEMNSTSFSPMRKELGLE